MFIIRCSGFNFTMCYVCTCNCEDEIVIFIATKVFLQGIIVAIQRMQNMKECIVGSLLKYQLKFFCNTIRVHGTPLSGPPSIAGIYSGTLPYGHPWKPAIYDIVETSFASECIYVCLCTIKTPEMRKPPYSIKQTGSPGSTVPELYKCQ